MTSSGDDPDFARISRIHTQWSLIQQAHQPLSPEAAQQARAVMVSRYIAPIYRYLNKIIGDPDAAEDVAHEIVLKLMQGRLVNASPEQGRFRDYLKTVLINTARSWQKRDETHRAARAEFEDLAAEPETQGFEKCIRDDVMRAAWNDLEECELRTRQPFASVLKWRTTVTTTTTEGLLELLRNVTGREYSGSNARKILQRAREHYAHLLLERVRQLLPPDQRDNAALEEELMVLGLHGTCRTAMQSPQQLH